MTIELPTRAVRDYLRAFDLGAIYLVAPRGDTPVGLGVGKQLPGDRRVAACWWADSLSHAHDVADLVLGCDLRTAPRAGPMLAIAVPVACAAIAAAAARLSVRLVCHDVVVARASGLVTRLDDNLAAAQQTGGMRDFNREYQRRRMEAAARRLPFPSYNVALAKLRAALAGTRAGTAASEIMRAVFEEPVA
jgi:hypothetical protein